MRINGILYEGVAVVLQPVTSNATALYIYLNLTYAPHYRSVRRVATKNYLCSNQLNPGLRQREIGVDMADMAAPGRSTASSRTGFGRGRGRGRGLHVPTTPPGTHPSIRTHALLCCCNMLEMNTLLQMYHFVRRATFWPQYSFERKNLVH